MTIPSELQDIIESTPDTLHGTVRFKGTRVFVQSLFDYVLRGNPLSEFLDHFPDVSEEQALRVLAWERERIMRDYGQVA